MKNLKKIIAMGLTAALCAVSLVGCGGTQNGGTDGATQMLKIHTKSAYFNTQTTRRLITAVRALSRDLIQRVSSMILQNHLQKETTQQIHKSHSNLFHKVWTLYAVSQHRLHRLATMRLMRQKFL